MGSNRGLFRTLGALGDIVLASRLPSLGSCLHTTMSLRASVMPFERSGISSKRSAKRLTISEAYRVFTPVIDT